ncbi:MAG: TolC family protein [Bacteroidetes bacterium]|nr:TolC family protein [Bacteroidota bacterium]
MKFKFVLLLLQLACIHKMAAQDSSQTYSFSAEQAVAFAMQNSVNVQNALLDIDIAKKKISELTGIGLPQITAQGDLKYYAKAPIVLFPNFGKVVYDILAAEQLLSNAPPDLPGSVPATFFTKYVATGSISASQLIFDGTYIIGLKASHKYKELTAKTAEQVKIETSATIRKSYYNVLVSRERAKILVSNINRLQKLFSETEAMYKEGFVEEIDKKRLEVSLNNLKTEKENIDRMLLLGEYVLKFQMGMDVNDSIILTDELTDDDLSNYSSSLQNVNVNNRIEYQVLLTTRELQKLNVKRNQYAYLPNIVAYGSWQGQALRNEFDIFDTKQKWYPTGIIGGSINLPIFDGFQKRARISQEKLTLKKLDNGIKQFENASGLENMTAKINLQNALASLETQKKNKELAEEVLNVTRIKYNEGVGSNIEVVNAEAAVQEASSNYFNALYNAIVSKIDLDKSIGAIK